MGWSCRNLVGTWSHFRLDDSVLIRLEKITSKNTDYFYGREPTELLTPGQSRISTSHGEKSGETRSRDFIWAKAEMQGFRDEMEDAYSINIKA